MISIALCPWELLSSAATFISVLSAYSVFLGPMVGIQICEYWILRHRRIKLSDLYHRRPDGVYYFWHGLNWRSFVSWSVGWASQIPGFANAVNPGIKVPSGCQELYYLAYPLGFAISFLVHWALNIAFPPRGQGDIDEVDFYHTFTPEEAAKWGIAPYEESIEGVGFAPPEDAKRAGLEDVKPL